MDVMTEHFCHITWKDVIMFVYRINMMVFSKISKITVLIYKISQIEFFKLSLFIIAMGLFGIISTSRVYISQSLREIYNPTGK